MTSLSLAFSVAVPIATPSFQLLSPQQLSQRTQPHHDHHSSRKWAARHARPTPSSSASSPVPVSTGVQQTPATWTAQTHPLMLYNTMEREKQPFTTLEPNLVRFYSCGPTVYDYAHIGNFRAFLTYDVIKRWLLVRGYSVNHVMNLTDVDDKIIAKAKALSVTAKSLTDKFTAAFFDDLVLLNIIPATHYPRATDHINDIEDVVTTLKKGGFAYESDGSTYFSVADFQSYGRLAQLEKRQPGAHTTALDADEYDKNDARDFALWKAYKPDDADVFWNSSLGKGRPGWHIECSCMAIKYLGPQLDLHAGGIDLVFPHHENEIAQSEAFTGRPFSTFWLHNGFVNIDDEKMSKSLGNFRTLRDIVKKPDDARAFRYLVVSSQYRSALAFTDQCMKSARSTVKRLDALVMRLKKVHDELPASDISTIIDTQWYNFCIAMDDDINTPRASAAMFAVVNAAEKRLKSGQLGKQDAQQTLDCLEKMDLIFGIFYIPELDSVKDSAADDETAGADAPAEVLRMLEERKAARKAKDFALADSLRDAITAAGYAIVDTPQGAKLEPLDT